MITIHDILDKYNLGLPSFSLSEEVISSSYIFFELILYSRNDTRGNMQYNYVDVIPGFYTSDSTMESRLNKMLDFSYFI